MVERGKNEREFQSRILIRVERTLYKYIKMPAKNPSIKFVH